MRTFHRWLLIPLLILAATGLSACSLFVKPPTSGTIIATQFIPAHDETHQVAVASYDYGCHSVSTFDPETDGYEFRNVCEYFYGYHGKTKPVTDHIPDRWTVTFRGQATNGKEQQRTIDISKSVYDQAKKGYHITTDPLKITEE